MENEKDRDQEFEQMMEQRMRENFSAANADAQKSFTDERLAEMNKKLPEWSLEPPYSFIR